MESKTDLLGKTDRESDRIMIEIMADCFSARESGAIAMESWP